MEPLLSPSYKFEEEEEGKEGREEEEEEAAPPAGHSCVRHCFSGLILTDFSPSFLV